MTTAAIHQVGEQRDKLVSAQFDVRDTNIRVTRELFESRLHDVESRLTERLDAMDKASAVLASDITRTPTLLQSAIRSLTELEDVKFRGLKELGETQFAAVDQRFVDLRDRTTEDKRVAQEALVAALAAAKELVGKQNEFSAAAIGKSEANTTTTIEQNRQLADANFAGLARQVLDLKDSLALWRQDMMTAIGALRTELAQVQTARLTVHEGKTDTRVVTTIAIAAVGLVVTIIVAAVSIYAIAKP
jgi:hypothetical protein